MPQSPRPIHVDDLPESQKITPVLALEITPELGLCGVYAAFERILSVVKCAHGAHDIEVVHTTNALTVGRRLSALELAALLSAAQDAWDTDNREREEGALADELSLGDICWLAGEPRCSRAFEEFDSRGWYLECVRSASHYGMCIATSDSDEVAAMGRGGREY